MRVTQEVVTVLADPQAGEINIVLAGMRIVLSTEESSQLAQGLAASLERLAGSAVQPAAPAEAWSVRRAPTDETADSSLAEAEAIQHRARALIRATMRAKGLSLGEEIKE
jgi:hypothetical protein